MKKVFFASICVSAGFVLAVLFLGATLHVRAGGADVGASQNGDVNGDGELDVSDAVFLLLYLFKSGEPPAICHSLSDRTRITELEIRLQECQAALEGGCPKDRFEPNDSAAAAGTAPGIAEGAVSCPDDEDWYALEITSTLGDLRVKLDSIEACNFDITLYEDDGFTPVQACTDFDCDESGRCSCSRALSPAQLSASPPLLLYAPDLGMGRYLLRV